MDEANEPQEAPEEQSQPIEAQKQEQPKEKKPFFKFKQKQPGEPGKIKRIISQWRRTLEVARKPGKEEYIESAKITGMGIALLGFIGFIIFMAFRLVM